MSAVETRRLSRHIWTERFRLRATSGVDAGTTFDSKGIEVTVGSDPGNDLRLRDKTVSRHHCYFAITPEGIALHDLGSTNGTTLGGHRIKSAFASPGSVIGVGQTTLVLEQLDDEYCEALSPSDRFGSVLGTSTALRRVFAIAERVADADATVLIEGETGTGKGLLAESIHEASARRDAPFVVVDCTAIPGPLFESELFGHERGAFTGATESRTGIIEAADGGTVFLDEIGELPLELQPKLLRVLERKTIQRVGSSRSRTVNVRFIAATNRNLREDVNSGMFRADLWHRLATVRLRMPPLRERREDIPLLVRHFYEEFARTQREVPPGAVEAFQRRKWPGNVRELRAAVEQLAIFETLDAWHAAQAQSPANATEQPTSFSQAKLAAVAEWEHAYLDRLLIQANGNLSEAARIARMDRVHLKRLLRRHNLRGAR